MQNSFQLAWSFIQEIKTKEMASKVFEYNETISFPTKVSTLTANAATDPQVYNGWILINEASQNFMRELNVRKAIMALNVNNAEGVDRIPQRVLMKVLMKVLIKPIARSTIR